MKSGGMQKLTDQQLVDRFVHIALAQDEAIIQDEIARYNRLYGEADAVEADEKAAR